MKIYDGYSHPGEYEAPRRPMSTTTTTRTRDERPRAGAEEVTQTNPDRWGDVTASERAPRQFEPVCRYRLPNTCDDENQRV